MSALCGLLRRLRPRRRLRWVCPRCLTVVSITDSRTAFDTVRSHFDIEHPEGGEPR